MAVLCAGGGVAHGQATTTTTTTTAAEPTGADAPPDPSGDEVPDQTSAPTDDSGKPGRLRLRLENVAPQRIFFRGSQPATFRYELAGAHKRDIVIEVVRKGGTVMQRWTPDDVEPGTTQARSWGGKQRRKGAAASGTYLFRVREQGGDLAERSKADGDRSFGYYDHIFPIRGKHTYGDGLGAPRRGHSHQGQDVFANCGTPLDAARAGKVQFKGFQGGGAGYYVVIDGKKTGRDYVYMHLKGKAEVGEGERVRTGQRIGAVGESGNASGCHLHFELWSKPGWYEGGHFVNPTKKLKRWDRWS